MATRVERIPLSRIAERAGDIDARRLLLAAVTLPLMLVGLLAAVVWAVISWACAAVLVGWETGRDLTAGQVDGAADGRTVRRGG